MEKDPRKFLVIIRPGSAAAALIGTDPDKIFSDMPALACSEMDLSGPHARVKRIPVESSRAGKNGVQAQVIWIAIEDIASAIEYTGPETSVGFGS